jgi:CMP/dCMP kinase
LTLPVITISRQRGSGADDIAQIVAQTLDVPLYDRQVLTRAAAAAGVDETTIATSERRQNLLTRIFEELGRYGSLGIGAPSPSFDEPSSLIASPDFRAVVEQVVQGLAAAGPCVIVGHGGAQVALRDRPDVLHIFTHAPVEQRVLRMMAYGGLDRAAAEKDVREGDSERRAYFKDYYGIDWYDLRLYDLAINTAGRAYTGVAAQICAAARAFNVVQHEALTRPRV